MPDEIRLFHVFEFLIEAYALELLESPGIVPWEMSRKLFFTSIEKL